MIAKCPKCTSTNIIVRSRDIDCNECIECGHLFAQLSSLDYDPKNTGSIKAAIVKIKADHLTARIMTVLDEFYQDNCFVDGTMEVTKENAADLQASIKCKMAIAIESLK